MAGERIGKTYEALTKVVLESLKERGVFKGDIFWNHRPEGLVVNPDFSIGEDENHPDVIILVTHCGSSKNSDMKCWRNLSELREAKTSLEPMPYVINVIYDSVMKENLKVLQSAAFDGQVIIGDLSYGRDLEKWVFANEAALPTDQDEKAAVLGAKSKTDPTLSCLLVLLERDIAQSLAQRQPDLDQLWGLERARPRTKARRYKTTSVRRGISKLLIFEDVELAMRLFRGKKVLMEEVPDYVFSIGLAKKAIGRATPNDIEIRDAVELLTDSEIRALVESMDGNAVLQGWLHQLRNIPSIDVMGVYIKKEFEALCDSAELYSRIVQLHDEPDALVDGYDLPVSWPPAHVWLIGYLIEVIKAASKRSNGYGIAQLAKDVVAAGYGSEADLSSAGQFGGGFGFSSWVMRRQSPFRDDLVSGMAEVLSSRLSDIGREVIFRLIDSKAVAETLVNNLIKAKLCTYPGFSPLWLLMMHAGIITPQTESTKIRTCFAEKAGLTGQSGKTTVLQVQHTIINWQSATDAGRDHKRNELCGRAVGLRYAWDGTHHKFIPRPTVKKLILVLDGTWRQNDLDALARAGWDEIYYPDEMSKLQNAIV